MNNILITGVGSDLQGVGRAEDGRAVFIPGALPGETVLAEITRDGGRFLEARLIEITHPSPDRVTPACPYYAECGGCQAMHMSYSHSLALKQQRVGDALQRIGGFADAVISKAAPSPEQTRYRNKAEYAVQNGRAGFMRAGSHDIVEIRDCLLQKTESIKALAAFRRWMAQYAKSSLRYFVTRVTDDTLTATVSSEGDPGDLASLMPMLRDNLAGMREISIWHCALRPRYTHALDGRMTHISGPREHIASLGGLSFHLSPQAFFQVNTPQAETLYTAAFKNAHLTGAETVLDAYCGAGTISLFLAGAAKKLIGIEIIADAISDARANAAANHLSERTEFIAGRVEDVLPRLIKGGLRPDVAVVDPPRKGLEPRVIDAIRAAAPKRIVYVSCNPATLARDLKLFAQDGRYHLETTQPFDMFPWTEHVETAVLLSKRVPQSHIMVETEFGEGEGKLSIDKNAERAKKYQLQKSYL